MKPNYADIAPRWLESAAAEAYDLLLTLAQIPAPSGQEEKRAAFCLNWLEQAGAKGVYMDEALNVIYPIGDRGDNPLAVIMAHSDVVFPDLTPLPLRVEDGKIFCPGVGDDTANAVAVMMAAKYVAQNGLVPGETGLLLV
ncbi:MAG: M20/M25/M40 family metallo-hydrolase, partial [Clostridia bacterium]|nr:M20/M25/M40 family metallo-hydrolase [Clostridia bacterium]